MGSGLVVEKETLRISVTIYWRIEEIPYLTHFAEFLQTAQDQDEDQDEGDVYGNEVEDDYSDDDDFFRSNLLYRLVL